MRILVVTPRFYPEQFRINDICTSLAENGNQVTVLTGLPNYPTGIVPEKYKWFKNRKEKYNKINVIRCLEIGRRKGKLGIALNYLSFLFSASLKCLFIKKDFDIIFVYQVSPVTSAIPAIILSKITGKKCILYCLDLWPESLKAYNIRPDSLIYRILLPISRLIYKTADIIAVSSKSFRHYFKSVLNLDKDIKYLPQYAEEMFGSTKAVREKDNDCINLVFAGNIGKVQSVETIILAANELKEHKNIKFHIIGDGSNFESCSRLAAELNLDNIIFYGQKPLEQMPEFYSEADAMLITLKKDDFLSYTLPGKVQSYMAAAKPILGAVDGETMQVINSSGCGYCTDAENYLGLAGIIRKFADEKNKHPEFSSKSLEYYKEYFEKDRFFSSLYDLLESKN